MNNFKPITLNFRGNIFNVTRKDFAYNIFLVVDERTGICMLSNTISIPPKGIKIGRIKPNNIFNINTNCRIFKCLVFDTYQPPNDLLGKNHRKLFDHFDLKIEGELYFEHHI